MNPCSEYRGFTSNELNQILLPKSVESLYAKLGAIQSKLATLNSLLPVLGEVDVNMKFLAETSWEFYYYCLENSLSQVTSGFEDVIGCQVNKPK